jgi:hypothetical protein
MAFTSGDLGYTVGFEHGDVTVVGRPRTSGNLDRAEVLA